MSFTLDPATIIMVVVALALGLFLGTALTGGARRRAAVLSERLDALARERDTLLADRDRLAVDIKAREAQIRPLADEVDKLRRDFARGRAGQESAVASAGTTRLADGGARAIETRAIDANDLRQLKGVGPKFADRLAAAGITRIDQIAGWSQADIEVIDSQMGDFRGRIAADRLVEQSQLLTESRVTEYETRFGKLGG
jgi:predicted flap endonuclease-1-like 5' DNA nuclease